jgi:hypothetical protein
MRFQPYFDDRPFGVQMLIGIVVPVVFGILTGLALGWNGVVYWIMIGPLAIVGGFLGGTEHRSTEDGFVRGVIGGLVYGSFVLIGFEFANTEPEAYLGEPHVGLVLVTTLVGGILGALGGYVRARAEEGKKAEPAASG